MSNSTLASPAPRAVKPPPPPGQPGAREQAPQSADGMKIAQTALQSLGISTRSPYGPFTGPPEYALAVSLIFTNATNQTIIVGTPPDHVLSTSILWNSLVHDKRFTQIPMSKAAPGDIITGSGWQQGADGYTGIVVDHGRIVSNSGKGVQDNSSLVEIQRRHPGMVFFRYTGVPGHRSYPLANAGFNPDEARVPAGQPGGGQWTSGMAPSTAVVSGGNPRTTAQEAPAAKEANPQPGKPTTERAAEASKLSELAQTYLEKAKEEDQAAALAVATSRMGDEYLRHKAAADSARSIAEELQRRAYILENGTEGNYRRLMLQQYGVNNPELNKIAAYYAEKFHDQATLNWLKLQHPAERPKIDTNGLAMMAFFPEGEAGEEASVGGGTEEESAFEKANKVEGADTSENDTATLKPYNEGSGHHVPAKSAFKGDSVYNPSTAPAIPNSELDRLNIDHDLVTGAQQRLYRSYAQIGKPLTWDAVQSIETKAIVKGGMSRAAAEATVSKAINALKAAGVKQPTRIPWGGK